MAAKDLMIDIETLSTATDALVLSIGATPFTCTRTGIDVDDNGLLLVPDLFEQLLLGRRVDRETQLWWSRQPAQVQCHWRFPDPNEAGPVAQCLDRLNALIVNTKPGRVWARGPHFDIAILDSLYQLVGIIPAWRYNAIRDVRTFCDDRPITRTYDGPSVMRSEHHPLRDNFDQIIDLWQHGMGIDVDAPPVPRDRECEAERVA